MSGTSALGRWESYWQLLLWTPHQCSLTLLGRSQEPAWTAVRKMLREGSIAAVLWTRPLWSPCPAPPAEPRPPGGPDQRLVRVSPPWTQQWANSRIGQQQLNHFRRKFAIHGRNIHKAVSIYQETNEKVCVSGTSKIDQVTEQNVRQPWFRYYLDKPCMYQKKISKSRLPHVLLCNLINFWGK